MSNPLTDSCLSSTVTLLLFFYCDSGTTLCNPNFPIVILDSRDLRSLTLIPFYVEIVNFVKYVKLLTSLNMWSRIPYKYLLPTRRYCLSQHTLYVIRLVR